MAEIPQLPSSVNSRLFAGFKTAVQCVQQDVRIKIQQPTAHWSRIGSSLLSRRMVNVPIKSLQEAGRTELF